MKVTAFLAVAALAFAACATTEPRPPAPGEPGLEVGTAAAPAEPPAVVVRVKKVEGKFVAEVVDVKSSGTAPPDAAARKAAVDRVQTLFGNRAKVVDPQQAPAPAAPSAR